MAHDSNGNCECVANHNPNPMELHRHHIWPTGMGGPDIEWNLVWLCPTSHVNVHELLRAWVEADGVPDWNIRKRFGSYIRGLAQEGFERWKNYGSPSDLTAMEQDARLSEGSCQ